MDLRRLALDGVVLLGHVLSGQDGKLALASDLGAAVAGGDAWFAEFIKSADDYVQQNGLDLPNEERQREALPDPKEVLAPILELDLRATGISSVIWANGFRYDFDWVHLPVFAEMSDPPRKEPIHRRGVTDVRGAYFIGLPWLSKLKSSLMAGAGEDAAFLAECIAARS